MLGEAVAAGVATLEVVLLPATLDGGAVGCDLLVTGGALGALLTIAGGDFSVAVER